MAITADDYWRMLQQQRGSGGMFDNVPTGTFTDELNMPAAQAQPMSQRAQEALAGVGADVGLGAGQQALTALGMGATAPQAIGAGLGSVVSPGTALNIATAPAYAQAGLTPESNFISYASKALPFGLGMLGGLPGALLGSAIADPVATAIQDYTGQRMYDEMRDKYLEALDPQTSTVSQNLAGYQAWADAMQGLDQDFVASKEQRYGALSPEKAKGLAEYDTMLGTTPEAKYDAAKMLEAMTRVEQARQKASGIEPSSYYSGRRATFSPSNPGGLTAQELSMRQANAMPDFGLMDFGGRGGRSGSAFGMGRSKSQGGSGVGARGTGARGTGLSGSKDKDNDDE